MLLVVLVTGMVRAGSLSGWSRPRRPSSWWWSLPGLVSVSLQQQGVVADPERLQAARTVALRRPMTGGARCWVWARAPSRWARRVHRQPARRRQPPARRRPQHLAGGLQRAQAGRPGGVRWPSSSWRSRGRGVPGSSRGDPVGAAVCAGLVGTAVAATFVTEQYYLPFWLLAALARGRLPPKARRAAAVTGMRVVRVLTLDAGGPVDSCRRRRAGLASRGRQPRPRPRTLRTDTARAAGVTWHEAAGDLEGRRARRGGGAPAVVAAPRRRCTCQDRRARLARPRLAPALQGAATGVGVVYTLHGVADGLSDLVAGSALAAPRRRRDRLYLPDRGQLVTRWGRSRVVVELRRRPVRRQARRAAVPDRRRGANGVPARRFATADRPEAPQAVWVRVLAPVKRVGLLLDAVFGGPRLQLRIVGDGCGRRSPRCASPTSLGGRADRAGGRPSPPRGRRPVRADLRRRELPGRAARGHGRWPAGRQHGGRRRPGGRRDSVDGLLCQSTAPRPGGPSAPSSATSTCAPGSAPRRVAGSSRLHARALPRWADRHLSRSQEG